MPSITIDTDRFLDGMRQILESSSMGSSRSSDDVTNALEGLDATIKKSASEAKKIEAAKAKTQRNSEIIFKSFSQRIKQFSDDLKSQSEVISSAYSDARDQMEYEAYDRIPDALQKTLAASGNTVMNVLSQHSLGSLEEADQMAERLMAINKLHATYAGDLSKQDEYLRRVTPIMDELGLHAGDTASMLDLLDETAKGATDALAEMADKARGGVFANVKDKMVALSAVTGSVVAGFKVLASQFEMVAQPALRYGTDVLDSYEAFMAGMNPEEFASVQAQYRQQIGSAGMSLDQFQNTIMDGATGLTAFTGELKDSVRLQAESFATARRFGIAGEQATKRFIQGQNTLFQELNTVFSMTAEEFVQMNEQIKQSAAVQSRIYRLNRQQRQLYIEQYQQTVRQLKINGLQQEAAMAAADAMAQLGAESPKERLKKAAKLQAVGGALGFGGEAAEAAAMLRSGDTANPRFAELMTTMQKRTGSVMGQGFGQEMMVSQMLETTGLGQMLGPDSAFAKLNTQQYEKMTDLEKSATKREKKLGDISAMISRLNNMIMGPIGAHIGTIAAGVTLIAGWIASKAAMKSISDAGGVMNMLKQAGGMFGKIAGGALVAGALAGAATIGWQIGTIIFEALQKHFPELVSGIGSAIASVLQYIPGTDAYELAKNKTTTPAASVVDPAAHALREDIAQGQAQIKSMKSLIETFESNIARMQEDGVTEAEREAIEMQKDGIKLQQDNIKKVQEGNEKVQALLEKHLKKAEEGNETAEKQLKEAEKANNKSSKSNQLRWTLAG